MASRARSRYFVQQIIPMVIAPHIRDEFHRDLTVFLRGHGISHYRPIQVNGDLGFRDDTVYID